MSRENVDAFKRAAEAYNRRDVEALLETLDPEVEWHPALQSLLQGETTVYRGHDGIREFFRDMDDVLDEIDAEYAEIRDLGDRIVALGRVRTRGKMSGAEVESPVGTVIDFQNGKAIRIQNYFDPKEALEAAGLTE